jgi:hypothetical protein
MEAAKRILLFFFLWLFFLLSPHFKRRVRRIESELVPEDFDAAQKAAVSQRKRFPLFPPITLYLFRLFFQ